MHILKCYLANDASGRFVTADNTARAPDGVWTCASCSCVLYLLTGFGEPPWFEHDKQTVAEHVLMNCVHQDPGPGGQSRSPTPETAPPHWWAGGAGGIACLVLRVVWQPLSGCEVLRQLPDRYLQHRRGELADELLRQHTPGNKPCAHLLYQIVTAQPESTKENLHRESFLF